VNDESRPLERPRQLSHREHTEPNTASAITGRDLDELRQRGLRRSFARHVAATRRSASCRSPRVLSSNSIACSRTMRS
jgi:hypothetical protein